MEQKTKALAVADFFLRKTEEIGKVLTPLQLIKIVYLAHGWFLGLYGRPLLDEAVQAWKYGPVIPSVYHAVKIFGNSGISVSFLKRYRSERFSPEEENIMEQTLDIYGGYSGLQLSSLTHQEGTPWKEIWDGSKCKEIPDASIRRHFEELVDNGD